MVLIPDNDNIFFFAQRSVWQFHNLATPGLFGWLVADGWCWFVLREEYCWLVAGG
jgi:hypothetical protein